MIFILFFRFTTQVDTRKKWIEVLNIDPAVDNPDKVVVCSEHFKKDDYYLKADGSRMLKRKMVPSVGLNHKKARIETTTLATTPTTSHDKENSPANQIQSETIDTSLCVDNKVEKGISFCNYFFLLLIYLNTGQSVEKTPPPLTSTPRHIGDISTPHFSTPRRRKRSIDLIRKEVDQYRHKIRMLQQKSRRLVSRIQNMKQMVAHLRNKGLISESATQSIVVGLQKIIDNTDGNTDSIKAEV